MVLGMKPNKIRLKVKRETIRQIASLEGVRGGGGLETEKGHSLCVAGCSAAVAGLCA